MVLRSCLFFLLRTPWDCWSSSISLYACLTSENVAKKSYNVGLCDHLPATLQVQAETFRPAGPWLCIAFLVRRVGAGHEWVGEDWLCCSIWLASFWLFRGDGHHWHWEADNSLTAGWRQQSCVHHQCITRQWHNVRVKSLGKIKADSERQHARQLCFGLFFLFFFVFVSYIKYALLLLLVPFLSAIFIPGAGRLQ